MRWLLPLVVFLIPACSGDTADPIVRLPATLADMDYPNGHPLVRNAPYNAAVAQLERQHLDLVNVWRQSRGLPAFSRCDSLDAIARAYSEHMSIEPFFGHIAPEGGDLADRVYAASGVVMVYSAENIMRTADPNAAYVLAAFLASPAHEANLLTASGSALGVGIYGDGLYYNVTYEFIWR